MTVSMIPWGPHLLHWIKKFLALVKRRGLDAALADTGAWALHRWYEKNTGPWPELGGLRLPEFLHQQIIPPGGARCYDYRHWAQVGAQLPRQLFTVIVSAGTAEQTGRTYAFLAGSENLGVQILQVGSFAGADNSRVVSSASEALARATGRWLVPVAAGDELLPFALTQLAFTWKEQTPVLLYSDEEQVDEVGHYSAYFKPDWSPELFLEAGLGRGLWMIERNAALEVGGIDETMGPAEWFDLGLRLSERHSVVHDRRLLYRAVPTPPERLEAERRAAQAALERRRLKGEVRINERKQLQVILKPQSTPLVSVILPTRNGGDLVNRCLKSLYEKTAYAPFEVLLVDNHSDEAASIEVFRHWEATQDNLTCLQDPQPFNFAAINNQAVTQAKGELLLFLNNDTEILDSDWMGQLVAQAERPEIGAVGATLLYPDGRLQHAGIALGIFGLAGHLWRFAEPERLDPRLGHSNNYLAVTGACLMCRRTVFEEVGQFNENFASDFNDVDLCLRMYEAGYRQLLLPEVRLVHHEAVSRSLEPSAEKMVRLKKEVTAFRDRWAHLINDDPYFPLALSAAHEDGLIQLESAPDRLSELREPFLELLGES